MTDVFHHWLESNKKDVLVEWREFIDSMGDVEVYEQTTCTKLEALNLMTDGSNSAFMDFARQSYEDSRDFSNSSFHP